MKHPGLPSPPSQPPQQCHHASSTLLRSHISYCRTREQRCNWARCDGCDSSQLATCHQGRELGTVYAQKLISKETLDSADISGKAREGATDLSEGDLEGHPPRRLCTNTLPAGSFAFLERLSRPPSLPRLVSCPDVGTAGQKVQPGVHPGSCGRPHPSPPLMPAPPGRPRHSAWPPSLPESRVVLVPVPVPASRGQKAVWPLQTHGHFPGKGSGRPAGFPRPTSFHR